MEKTTKMSLKCPFCSSTQFELPEKGYQPKSGEQIKCSGCGRSSDYDSMMRVIRRKGRDWAEKQAQGIIRDFEKELRKKLR